MKNNIEEKPTGEQMQLNIPVIEIVDPYGYIHSNRVIAHININGTNGKKKRQLLRTKKGGYMMT